MTRCPFRPFTFLVSLNSHSKNIFETTPSPRSWRAVDNGVESAPLGIHAGVISARPRPAGFDIGEASEVVGLLRSRRRRHPHPCLSCAARVTSGSLKWPLLLLLAQLASAFSSAARPALTSSSARAQACTVSSGALFASSAPSGCAPRCRRPRSRRLTAPARAATAKRWEERPVDSPGTRLWDDLRRAGTKPGTTPGSASSLPPAGRSQFPTLPTC